MCAVELEGQRVAVTGAAGGIGRAVCESLIRSGARVAGLDLNVDGMDDIGLGLATSGALVRLHVDVRQPKSIEDALGEAVLRMGGLDGLINAAGVTSRFPDFLDLPLDEWDRIHDINLRGSFIASQVAARHMIRTHEQDSPLVPHSYIINITSIVAERAFPDSVHYASSKGGVKQMTSCLAGALASRGIRVNAVGPGTVDTPLSRWGTSSPERQAAMVSRIPLGRVATPADIANVAVFLASAAAGYITGQTIYVDGGELASR